MRESINYCGADAKPSKRAWSGHKGDFFDVGPVLVVFFEFVVNEL